MKSRRDRTEAGGWLAGWIVGWMGGLYTEKALSSRLRGRCESLEASQGVTGAEQGERFAEDMKGMRRRHSPPFSLLPLLLFGSLCYGHLVSLEDSKGNRDK